MSGLDPVGRKDVRDLIVEERKRGRTVFFSTHILNDVETLCDRVTILSKGEVVVSGALSELLSRSVKYTDVVLANVSESIERDLGELGYTTRRAGVHFVVEAPGEQALKATVERALAVGATLYALTPRYETLEDLFVRKAVTSDKRPD